MLLTVKARLCSVRLALPAVTASSTTARARLSCLTLPASRPAMQQPNTTSLVTYSIFAVVHRLSTAMLLQNELYGQAGSTSQ